MQIRRQMMGVIASRGGSEQIGIFTKGYDAILTPEKVNLFTIPHNLGIIPRFCIIEIDESTQQLTTAFVQRGLIDFDIKGLYGGYTGRGGFRYFYNNTYSIAVVNIPSTNPNQVEIVYDESAITIKGYPYGTSRSQWDIHANYSVSVWG